MRPYDIVRSLSQQLTLRRFPRREDVDRANFSRLQALETETAKYQSTDGGNANEASRNKMLSNFMAPPLLTLKVDAQVCLQHSVIA